MGFDAEVSSYLKALRLEPDELYDEKAASSAFHLSPITLRNWRTQGKGPRYLRIGGSVRYLGRALAEYLAASEITPEAKRGAA